MNFGEATALATNKLVVQLREQGCRVEFYPEAAKMKKQLSYANQKDIPLVVLLGEEEFSRGEVVIKQMKTGEQQTVALAALSAKVSPALSLVCA